MKLTFPVGSVIKCFVILSNIKIKQTAKKKTFFFLLDAAWHTNVPWFQGARPYHVTCESNA